MYNNERNSRINILNILGRIIFLILFVLLLMWIFKIPNMTPFYSSIFRENISYMQDASKSYFTNDKLPKNIGETTSITLQEMVNKKLILPFLDKDGNSCNMYKSYAEVTKNVEEGYSLKVNLSCNNEEDYIVETLGCYNYCDIKDNTKCEDAKETRLQYQFKKSSQKKTTSCECPTGYSLKGKACYKNIDSSKISAKAIYEKNSNRIYNATLNVGKTNTVYIDYIYDEGGTSISCDSGYTLSSDEKSCTKKVALSYSSGGSYTETYTEQVPKTSSVCSSYTTVSGGWVTSTCSGKPCTVYQSGYQKCNGYKTVTTYESVTKTRTVSTSGGYYCAQGTRSGDQCIITKNPTVVTNVPTYTCPKGYSKSGEGTNTKCSKNVKESDTYYCSNSKDILQGSKCYELIIGRLLYYECPVSYNLSGSYCYKTTTKTVNTSCKTVTKKVYTYKWSNKKTLKGWTSTGKTRTVLVK